MSFIRPTSSDLIADGAAAITGNADETAALFAQSLSPRAGLATGSETGAGVRYLRASDMQALGLVGAASTATGALLSWTYPDRPVSVQIVYAASLATVWTRERIGSSGTWSAWRAAWAPTTPPSNAAAADALDGIAMVNGSTLLEWGLPAEQALLLSTKAPDRSVWQQVLVSTASGQIWARQRVGATAEWTAWASRSSASSAPTASTRPPSPVLARGGHRTASRPVIALRWDHGVDTWVTKVLPLLKRFRLPSTLAVYTALWDRDKAAASYAAEPTTTTPAQLATALRESGTELASHSITHTQGPVTDEVVGSRRRLLELFPGINVTGWAQPGLSASPDWDAYRQALDSPNAYTDTTPGALIAATYGWASGGAGSRWPLGQAYGIHLLGGDTASLRPVLDKIVTEGQAAATTFMFHPAQIDQPGGRALSELTEFLEALAAHRDAGRIDVVTVGAIPALTTATATPYSLTPADSLAAGVALTLAIPTWAAGTPWQLQAKAPAPGTLTIGELSWPYPAGDVFIPFIPSAGATRVTASTNLTDVTILGI